MNTLEFLQTILPDEGIYYLVLFTKKLNEQGESFKLHRPYSDLESLAYAAEQFDQDPQFVAVYHACASYLAPCIELEGLNRWGKPARKYRVPENWSRAKSFWVDLDCGEEKFLKNQGYQAKRDAAAAIFRFSETVGWPKPMLVDSGNGVHAYWPLTKSISAKKWAAVSRVLKACLAHAGVIADPTRTADFASILRPAGTNNRKEGGCKPVLVRRECAPSDPAELAAALSEYASSNGVKLIKESSRPAANDINSDLTGHLTNQFPDIPVDAAVVADKCAQMGWFRDTGSSGNYEHWRCAIGITKYTTGGLEIAHEWSSNASDYDEAGTNTRYETWNAGPTKCETFSACNPKGCEGCEFKGKVTTPLQLGRVIPINVEQTETVVTDAGEEQEVEIPAIAYGYTWSNGLLARMLPDKDGIMQAHPFSNILFYPTSRIRTEDGTYRVGMRMHLPSKKVRDFEMTAEAMASQTDMLRALARYELMQSNHKDAGSHMAAYLRDQLEALKRKVEEVNTLTTFGWKDDETSFLLGDRLYLADGTTRKVLVAGGAAKYASAFKQPANADVTKYAEAINYMYSRPGREYLQYAVLAGWGSILAPFCEELYKGLILALQGGDSGKGKTTVSYASLYAFGDSIDMTMTSKDGFTYKALWAVMATFNNVPLLLDELTKMEATMFSDIAYGVSTGQERIRLNSKGGTVGFAPTLRWRLSPFVTGNCDFHGLLASEQGNSQAEAVRLIQISVDRYKPAPLVNPEIDRSTLDETERKLLEAQEAATVQQCIEQMKSNRGVAGEMLVKYVLTNREQVSKMVKSWVNHMVGPIPDNKYRYYRCHAACTLTIGHIAKELGIVDFDMDALYKFTVDMLQELVDSVDATNTIASDDAFSRLMASLASRIVVTAEFRDKRHKDGPETPRNRVNGEIAGRYVLGTPSRKDHAGHIMLSQKDVRDWCLRNRTDYNSLVNHLDAEGALIKRSEKLTLTRGTDMPTVQARCIVVDSYKLDKDALTLVSNNQSNELGSKAVGDV